MRVAPATKVAATQAWRRWMKKIETELRRRKGERRQETRHMACGFLAIFEGVRGRVKPVTDWKHRFVQFFPVSRTFYLRRKNAKGVRNLYVSHIEPFRNSVIW